MHGHRVEVVPDSVVHHELGSSRSEIPATVAYHAGRSKTRSFLQLLEPRSILRGLPGFLLAAVKIAACDVMLRSSPKSAVYRVLGYLAPILEAPELYEARKRIQRQRRRDDAAIVGRDATGE
jgi:GT2 family glycosyltransferase